MVKLSNGAIVMANAQTNADLSQAMRGGTGRKFGVLLSTYDPVCIGDLFCRNSIRFSIQSMEREAWAAD